MDLEENSGPKNQSRPSETKNKRQKRARKDSTKLTKNKQIEEPVPKKSATLVPPGTKKSSHIIENPSASFTTDNRTNENSRILGAPNPNIAPKMQQTEAIRQTEDKGGNEIEFLTPDPNQKPKNSKFTLNQEKPAIKVKDAIQMFQKSSGPTREQKKATNQLEAPSKSGDDSSEEEEEKSQKVPEKRKRGARKASGVRIGAKVAEEAAQTQNNLGPGEFTEEELARDNDDSGDSGGNKETDRDVNELNKAQNTAQKQPKKADTLLRQSVVLTPQEANSGPMGEENPWSVPFEATEQSNTQPNLNLHAENALISQIEQNQQKSTPREKSGFEDFDFNFAASPTNQNPSQASGVIGFGSETQNTQNDQNQKFGQNDAKSDQIQWGGFFTGDSNPVSTTNDLSLSNSGLVEPSNDFDFFGISQPKKAQIPQNPGTPDNASPFNPIKQPPAQPETTNFSRRAFKKQNRSTIVESARMSSNSLNKSRGRAVDSSKGSVGSKMRDFGKNGEKTPQEIQKYKLKTSQTMVISEELGDQDAKSETSRSLKGSSNAISSPKNLVVAGNEKNEKIGNLDEIGVGDEIVVGFGGGELDNKPSFQDNIASISDESEFGQEGLPIAINQPDLQIGQISQKTGLLGGPGESGQTKTLKNTQNDHNILQAEMAIKPPESTKIVQNQAQQVQQPPIKHPNLSEPAPKPPQKEEINLEKISPINLKEGDSGLDFDPFTTTHSIIQKNEQNKIDIIKFGGLGGDSSPKLPTILDQLTPKEPERLLGAVAKDLRGGLENAARTAFDFGFGVMGADLGGDQVNEGNDGVEENLMEGFEGVEVGQGAQNGQNLGNGENGLVEENDLAGGLQIVKKVEEVDTGQNGASQELIDPPIELNKARSNFTFKGFSASPEPPLEQLKSPEAGQGHRRTSGGEWDGFGDGFQPKKTLSVPAQNNFFGGQKQEIQPSEATIAHQKAPVDSSLGQNAQKTKKEAFDDPFAAFDILSLNTDTEAGEGVGGAGDGGIDTLDGLDGVGSRKDTGFGFDLVSEPGVQNMPKIGVNKPMNDQIDFFADAFGQQAAPNVLNMPQNAQDSQIHQPQNNQFFEGFSAQNMQPAHQTGINAPPTGPQTLQVPSENPKIQITPKISVENFEPELSQNQSVNKTVVSKESYDLENFINKSLNVSRMEQNKFDEEINFLVPDKSDPLHAFKYAFDGGDDDDEEAPGDGGAQK